MALRYAVPSPAYSAPIARTTKASPITPLQTKPPPPTNPPSWKYVNGTSCGAKQSGQWDRAMSIGGLRRLRPRAESRTEMAYVSAGAIVRRKFELAWISIALIYTLKVISARSSNSSGITGCPQPDGGRAALSRPRRRFSWCRF